MIIISYEDFDLLKESVSDERKALENLDAFKERKKKNDEEIFKARKAQREALKREDAVAYEQSKRLEEDLIKQRKQNEIELNKLAIQNTMRQSDEIEKMYLLQFKFENDIEDLRIQYSKEQDVEQKKRIKEEIKARKDGLDFTKKEIELSEKKNEYIKKAQALKDVGDKKAAKGATTELKKLEAEIKKNELDALIKSGNITEEEYDQYNRDIRNLELQTKNEEMLANLSDTIKKGLTDALNKGLDQVSEAIDDVTSHRTKIMARLQGYGGDEYDYSGMLSTVSRNLAASPYITQRAFMKKLDEAVDKGIAYNVEQRTFLATITDEIATTFNAFDSNLMRIIRLQQADSTAARLGMEAALTKTLNQVFSDTSYLSDMYDSVTQAIVDSEATMSRERATEFEYTVQKWLGSLYSLGASNNLISQIAQGLNYLGTGNVQALASNSPLQTLFAMSASRAEGLDYADLLVQGLDASNTNKLMKAMVEYLKEIAVTNKANNVVKAAYGDLYNMSLADMRAITSLSSSDITSIYAENMSYGDMTNSLSNQFSSISKRLSTGEMIKNVLDNFVYSIGSEISQNAVSYTIWQVTDLIEKATGGIHIPAVSVFGNMVDLSSFTLEGIMKTGLVGLNTLGQIGNIVSSLNSGGGLSLSGWNYADTLQRGQISETTTGSVASTSGSMTIGSSSSSDIKKSSLASAASGADEVSEITNTDQEDTYSVDDIYKAMYKDKTPVPVAVDMDNGLGYLLMQLANQMLSVNRVTDVNIKKADIQVPTVVTQMDNKFKEEIRNYIKSTYIELLADELRTSLIGQTKGFGGATIAKVCDKIMNDRVDVEVRNNNFDRFLDIQSGIFG